jgi:hypothetical protein
MAFSKSFPRTVGTSSYPIWEEIFLTEDEEREIEEISKKENVELMQSCFDDAKKIIIEKSNNESSGDIVSVAISLFNKLASHSVYHKENKTKEKFDEKFGNGPEGI